MCTPRRLRLERTPWDAVDDAYQARIPFDAPAAHADTLSRLVAAGAAAKHTLLVDGVRRGMVVTQVEQHARRELLVIACFCEGPDPMSDEIAAAVEALARAERCVSIRFHTIREAAARWAAERHGYRLTELVMRKTLS